jgi:hypothetical protein
MTADAGFLVIQPSLFAARDVTVVTARIVTLLHPDHVDPLVQAASLRGGEVAFTPLLADRALQVSEAVVHFHPTRVMSLPGGGRRGRIGGACRHHQTHGRDQDLTQFHGLRSFFSFSSFRIVGIDDDPKLGPPT